MKKLKLVILLTILGLFNFNIFAQEIKYNELSSTEPGYYNSYLASDGAIYKIGDKIKIGFPSSNKTFAFIWQGDGILVAATPLAASNSGTETEIKKIFVNGTKRTGYQVWMKTKGIIGLLNYSVQFENALSTGEIKGFGMTSDEALIQLKKAKDKLELGLISQDEYEQQKKELSKYIK
jgi:hypothetical protein